MHFAGLKRSNCDVGTVTFDIWSRSVKSIKTREIFGFIITVSLTLLIFCVATSTCTYMKALTIISVIIWKNALDISKVILIVWICIGYFKIYF